jgi:hypothetical protein
MDDEEAHRMTNIVELDPEKMRSIEWHRRANHLGMALADAQSRALAGRGGGRIQSSAQRERIRHIRDGGVRGTDGSGRNSVGLKPAASQA